MTKKKSASSLISELKRKTRKVYSSEDKIRIIIEDSIEEINQFDLILYLENDVTYIQDGTRLSIERRNELDLYHRQSSIYTSISIG